jgi:hypothetical protein
VLELKLARRLPRDYIIFYVCVNVKEKINCILSLPLIHVADIKDMSFSSFAPHGFYCILRGGNK